MSGASVRAMVRAERARRPVASTRPRQARLEGGGTRRARGALAASQLAHRHHIRSRHYAGLVYARVRKSYSITNESRAARRNDQCPMRQNQIFFSPATRDVPRPHRASRLSSLSISAFVFVSFTWFRMPQLPPVAAEKIERPARHSVSLRSAVVAHGSKRLSMRRTACRFPPPDVAAAATPDARATSRSVGAAPRSRDATSPASTCS